jgi:hypothetical protein
MKKLYQIFAVLPVLIVCLSVIQVQSAHAQTEPITATVSVQNALTITEVDPLDFGTVAVISDATDVATLSIDANTGALATTTTGAPAVFAVVDNTTASRAQITVEDGADGATLNFTINNVVNPIFGGNAFLLTGWETSWNGGGTTAQVVNTPFQYVFSSAYNAGVNELNIGAEIRTQTTVALYTDGTYPGSFDVVASY